MGGSGSKSKEPKAKKSNKKSANDSTTTAPISDSKPVETKPVENNTQSKSSSAPTTSVTPQSSITPETTTTTTSTTNSNNVSSSQSSETAAATTTVARSNSVDTASDGTFLVHEEKHEPRKSEVLKAAEQSKSLASRLGGPVSSTNDDKAHGSKMFTAPKEQHSKIYAALNPDKIWYESRREKDEISQDKVKLSIRGGGAGMEKAAVDYNEFSEEGGANEVQEEEEEDYDPNNLPTFDPETEAELIEKRKQRAEELKKKQDALKAKWEAKKRQEEEERQIELAKIAAKEAELKKLTEPEDKDKFIREAQERLEAAAKESYRQFSFKS